MLVGLLLGLGGWVAWRVVRQTQEAGKPTGQPDQALRVAVEVAPIVPGVLRDVRVLSGTLEASTRFDVAAKVGGLIERMAVDLGDEVQRDQVVAEIDDAEFVQAVAQTEAELAVRKAEHAQALAELGRVQREYDRLQSLSQRGVVSDVEMNEITASLASQQAAIALAEARVRQAEAALEIARIQIGYTHVSAVWEAGPDVVTVGQRYEDAGNTVQAGDPVVAVVALDPLTATVSITERDYARVRVGQPATLRTDAIPDRDFDAEIVRIAPVFREASRQARIELKVRNPERLLKPGMFARVSIVLREEHVPTIVPLAALTRRDGENVVFLLAEDEASVRRVPVQVGIVDGERAGVEGTGLTGEVVVLGQQMLTDGSAVTVHRPTTRAAGEGGGA